MQGHIEMGNFSTIPDGKAFKIGSLLAGENNVEPGEPDLFFGFGHCLPA